MNIYNYIKCVLFLNYLLRELKFSPFLLHFLCLQTIKKGIAQSESVIINEVKNRVGLVPYH